MEADFENEFLPHFSCYRIESKYQEFRGAIEKAYAYVHGCNLKQCVNESII